MQLSDGDRERLYELLSRHAAAGRVSIDELERRVEVATRIQTREEAAALLADLPPLATEAETAWWRERPHGETDRPAVEWRPTAERFRDPRTKRIMRVWVDADGGRHYVPESPAV